MKAYDNPLDVVWATYKTTRDCLKIADKVRIQNDSRLLEKTDFIFLQESEASERITTCHDESENFAILSLWAVFERFLIDYLVTKGQPLRSISPTTLAEGIYETFESAVEYRRIDEILDLFKGVVDSNLIGNAKNIKKYRDWVAHKNPRRGHSGKTDPLMAYGILSQIIQAINESDSDTPNESPRHL